jgi:hypothetical protein
MYDLIVDPQNFSKHVDRATASFSSIALFGQRATSQDDFWATVSRTSRGLSLSNVLTDAGRLRGHGSGMTETIQEQGVETNRREQVNAALSPGTYPPTEQFPILKWIPKQWLSSTTRAEQGFSTPTRIWTKAREYVEARRNQGDKRGSLMDELLDDESIRFDATFQGTKLANFVGALMQAAAETSALTMRTSIIFLATHPWVQDKAQKELDALCGVDRVPNFSDFKDLPYINCIMKEGLRIRPV